MTTVDEEQRRAEKMGAADFLAKPPKSEDVVKTVDALVPCNPGARRKRVALVVDDDPDDRYVMRTTLEANDWSVVEAEDGRDGLDKLRALNPISSLRIWSCRSWTALNWFGRFGRTRKSIPVVVMTGAI